MPLEAREKAFFLDGKKIQLVSGAIHYFRVVPEYWEDRLTRLKACGLNCVETYVAWNLHEQVRGRYDFDGILNIRQFVATAHQLGLYVLLRPGPYICAECDFGGLPSWLLRDPDMKVRSIYPPFLDAVHGYLTALITQVGSLQYSSGGPIIAIQVENEYGSYGNDMAYKMRLAKMFREVGFTELLFSSENGMGIRNGHTPGVLMTANFQELDHGALMFQYLRHIHDADMPLMVMELWSGWFDHWTEIHHVVCNQKFEAVLRWILCEIGGSVNIYMFHGGTNFGFVSGANDRLSATNDSYIIDYSPVVTSYDYDAPVAENGNLTGKYSVIRKVLHEVAANMSDAESVSETGIWLPNQVPKNLLAAAYGEVKFTRYLSFDNMLQYVPCVELKRPLTMEQLPINDDSGQCFGFVLYRKLVSQPQRLTFPGKVRDRAIVLLNGEEVETVDWTKPDHVVQLLHAKPGMNQVDVLVENCGRVNYADFASGLLNSQRKGLTEIHIDEQLTEDWTVFPIEFKKQFLETVSSSEISDVSWTESRPKSSQPCLCWATFNIEGHVHDTFINTTGYSVVKYLNSFYARKQLLL